MKLETKIQKIIGGGYTPKVTFLKLMSLAFTLVPGSIAQEQVRMLAETYRQEYNLKF